MAAGVGRTSWQLAYQSRSGPPSVPWLGPDINDCLTSLAKAGAPAVVVVPIGFVSDHMEVIFDLDVEAARTARDLGLPMARAATPGTDPRFVATDLQPGRRTSPPAPAARRSSTPGGGRSVLRSRAMCGGRCCRTVS